jgi:hypothetical protein
LKRQYKKTIKPIVSVRNIQNKTLKKVKIFINKNLWNKKKSYGDLINFTHVPTGDFISYNFMKKKGFNTVVLVKNCKFCNFEVLKSWDDRNHVIVKD